MILKRNGSDSRSPKLTDGSEKKSSSVPRPNRQQVISLRKNCPAKFGVNSEASTTSKVTIPAKHLGWYVALDRKPSEQKFKFPIPRTKWKCPPKFNLNVDWQTAAGEESQEIEVQRLRETTVVEARYPSLSDIPPSPFLSLDAGCEFHDDNAQVTIIPLEEVEGVKSARPRLTPSKLSISHNQHAENESILGQPNKMEGGDNPSTVASGAFSIVSALMENSGCFVNKLLFSMLSNPVIIKNLIFENGKKEKEPPSTCFPSLSSISFPRSDSDGNKHRYIEPLLKKIRSILFPELENQSHGLPNPEIERAVNIFTKTVEGHAKMFMSKSVGPFLNSKAYSMPPRKDWAEPNSQPAPHGLIHSTPRSNMEHSTPRPNMEDINKITSECWGVMPVAPLVHPSARTSVEKMNEVNSYNPSLLPSPPMDANGYAFTSAMDRNYSSEGMFRSSASPPINDFNYYKPLVSQHGQMQGTGQVPLYFGQPSNHKEVPQVSNELDLRIQRPAGMQFNSSRDFQKDPGFSYMHNNTVTHTRGSGVMEDPRAKRMRM